MLSGTSRRLALWALVLLLFPLLAACGGSPTAAPTATPEVSRAEPTDEPVAEVLPLREYVDPDGYFTISYPTDWKVEKETQKVTFSDDAIGLHITVQYADAGQALDEAGMRDLIDTYFSPESFGQVEGFEKVSETVQEDGSTLVEYSFGTGNLSGYGGSFFEQRDTIVYILSFWAMDSNQWDAHVSTFDAVAKSFKPTPTGDWNSLTSTVGGFEVSYPAGWEGLEAEGDAIVRKDDETFMLITSTVNTAADPDAVELQIVENAITALRGDDPDAQVSGPDTLVLDGEECSYADFGYTDPQTNLPNQGTVIGVVHAGRAYRLLIFSLTADAETNLPIFTNILLSFRFTN